MATVFKAEDLKHDRIVAIKVLSPDLSATIGADRFEREIKVAARLAHPNILPVYDSGAANGLLFYAMPFVEGESVRHKIERESQLAIEDAVQITAEVADALDYAHEQGVIHRDIKPENILLLRGRAIVADFGIARAVTSSGPGNATGPGKLTGTGMSLGTAAYMSPEQASGEEVDGRSDIYALGCTLYEMLAGEQPFSGKNQAAVMARHLIDPVPSVRTVRPAVPPELEEVIYRSMEKTPADRYKTMSEMRKALLGGGTSTFPRATASRTAQYRIHQNAGGNARRWWLIAAAVLVVATAVGVTGWFLRPPAAAPTDANHVAVLYFDDQSRDGSLRFVADQLTEQVIKGLSDVQALDVVSANGVRPFRGRDVASDSLAHALKVGSLVRGTVKQSGSTVSVRVGLVDAGSDREIAHNTISLDTAQITQLAPKVAEQVAVFLRERIHDQVRLSEERSETRNTEAWALVGRAEKLRKDADSLRLAGQRDSALLTLARGDSLLVAAAKLDAAWERVPTLRASFALLRAQTTGPKPELGAIVDSGLAAANKAIALRGNDPDAYEVKGALQWLKYSQHLVVDPRAAEALLAQAESSLTRAVTYNKNQAGAWVTLSSLQYRKPDVQAANIAARNAYRADAYMAAAPTILYRLFRTSYDMEEFPEAMRWCNQGRAQFPKNRLFVDCRLWMYTTPYDKPDVDSAWAYAKQYAGMWPEANRPYQTKMADILVAAAIARANLPDSARHVLLTTRPSATVPDPSRELEGNEAIVRVMLHDNSVAVALIKDYLTANPEHREGFVKRIHWWWRDLQTDPQFKALVAGAR
jgi:serine/threonine-protein kinase